MEAAQVDDYELAFKDVIEAAGELGQATPVWMAAFTAGAHEFLRGHLDRAEERALESLDLGQRASEPDAVFFFGVLLYAIRREQGRLDEVLDLTRLAVEQNEGIAGISAMLADACAQLGQPEDAQSLLDQLAASDFRDRPHDQIWSSIMWGCSETAFKLGDEPRAALLTELLAPYQGQLVYNGLVPLGSVASVRGRLALTTGRLEDAEAHLSHAIEIEDRMQALLFATRSRLGLAGVYVARNQPGDAEPARALLEQVVDTAREHGFTAIEAEARGVLEGLSG